MTTTSTSVTNLVYADLETATSDPKELSSLYAKSKVPIQRLMCARWLSLETDEDPVATASKLSRDSEWTVRQALAQSLGNLKLNDEKKIDKVVSLLLSLSRDSNQDVRSSAASSLAIFPHKTRIATWLSLTRDKDPRFRCSGAECLGQTAKELSETQLNTYIIPELLSLGQEDLNFLVRKTACRSLAKICEDTSTINSPNVIHWRYLASGCALKLAEDPAWPCRRAAVDAMPLICGGNKFDSTMATQLVALSESDSSKWVKQAAQRNLGKFIATSRLVACTDLLKSFAKLAQANDEEARFSFAFYLPGVLQAAPDQAQSRWTNHLKDAYAHLTTDSSSKVRRSLAHSIKLIAQSIGPTLTAQDLLGPYLSFLQDMDDEEEIRLGAVRCASAMLRALPPDRRREAMEEIEKTRVEVSNPPIASLAVSRDSRLSLAEQLPELARIEPVISELWKVVSFLAQDEAFHVRNRALDTLGETLPLLEGSDLLLKELETMASSPKYWSRWIFARACRSIFKNERAAMLAEKLGFKSKLIGLAKDPVLAVRTEAEEALGTCPR